MAGILSYGAYIPRMRLQRSAIYAANQWFAPGLKGLARGQRAIANWDEDTITMAVEAARDCLDGANRDSIGAVMLASTTLPYADRQNAGIVKEALNLPDAVAALDIGGSQRAGTSMLAQALKAAAGDGTPVLALAADQRRARPASEDELINGDAAAAFLVGPQDGIAKLIGAYSVTADFADHFRAAGEDYDYGWETRWVREEGHAKIGGAAIAGALKKFDLAPAEIAHLIVGIPARGAGAALAKKVGIAAEAVRDDLSSDLGNAGTAHPLTMLAHVLEAAKPGENILMLGFGQGADVLLFRATAAIDGTKPAVGVSGWLARSVREENYLKYLAFTGELRLELGKRAEFSPRPVLTALYRNRKAVLGLVGGRCTRTGTIQYPRSEISVDQTTLAVGTQEDYPLADRPARIMTYTADSLTYTPDPPNYYGMVEFEGGGRMMAEFTDVDPGAIEVGAPMRMMFRVKARNDQTGFIQYFWKAAPTAGSN
jgi:hydroxymethylglutaryl-CoA synthase